MVTWITERLGIKDSSSTLKEDEHGSVIVDLRDIPDGQLTEDMVINTVIKVVNCFNWYGAYCKNRIPYRVILQCQCGLSRSPTFAVVCLYQCEKMSWSDAILTVRKKVPQWYINYDLIDSIKKYFGIDER